MSKRAFPDDNYQPFAPLAVKKIRGANEGQQIAVHISGKLDDKRTPVICLADYYRNMSDFCDFITRFRTIFDMDWPIVLIDMAGRGRSSDRKNVSEYTSLNDAYDVSTIAAALGIERAIFMGQGHGGRVIMALGCISPHLICASILIDASPVLYAPGLIRMRDNLAMLTGLKSQSQFQNAAQKIYGVSHPGANEQLLKQIVHRTFFKQNSGRYQPIFDPKLLARLAHIEFSDIFEPQFSLFATLDNAPLMLLRTQLNDQLERATFEHMGNLRSDAVQLVIADQGAPALLSSEDEVGAIVEFVRHAARHYAGNTIVSG